MNKPAANPFTGLKGALAGLMSGWMELLLGVLFRRRITAALAALEALFAQWQAGTLPPLAPAAPVAAIPALPARVRKASRAPRAPCGEPRAPRAARPASVGTSALRRRPATPALTPRGVNIHPQRLCAPLPTHDRARCRRKSSLLRTPKRVLIVAKQ